MATEAGIQFYTYMSTLYLLPYYTLESTCVIILVIIAPYGNDVSKTATYICYQNSFWVESCLDYYQLHHFHTNVHFQEKWLVASPVC